MSVISSNFSNHLVRFSPLLNPLCNQNSLALWTPLRKTNTSVRFAYITDLNTLVHVYKRQTAQLRVTCRSNAQVGPDRLRLCPSSKSRSVDGYCGLDSRYPIPIKLDCGPHSMAWRDLTGTENTTLWHPIVSRILFRYHSIVFNPYTVAVGHQPSTFASRFSLTGLKVILLTASLAKQLFLVPWGDLKGNYE